MNIALEMEGFREWADVHPIPPSVEKLWRALLLIKAACHWKERFNAPSKLVEQQSGLAKQTVSIARQLLVKHGLIVYEMGCRGKAPRYQLVSFVNDPFLAQRLTSASDMDQSMDKSLLAEPSLDYSRQRDEACKLALNKELASSQVMEQSTNSMETRPQNWNVLEEVVEDRRRGGGTRANRAYTIFEQNFGTLRPILHEPFFSWCNKLGEDVVIAGIKLTAEKGGGCYSYMEQIFIEWDKAGLASLEQVQAYEKQKKAARYVKKTAGTERNGKVAIFNKFREGNQ